MTTTQDALREMIEIAERVDGWQSFPADAIERARAALSQQEPQPVAYALRGKGGMFNYTAELQAIERARERYYPAAVIVPLYTAAAQNQKEPK